MTSVVAGMRAGVALILLAGMGHACAAETCTPALGHIVSIQGSAELRRGASAWVGVGPDAPLCSGDVVRVLRHSRVAIRLADATMLRLDQGTTLALAPPGPRRTTLLEQISGRMHVITRAPRALGIRTPFVNATIEGTEFSVLLTDDAATVAVVEGVVVADNPAGATSLGRGEAATATRGGAPLRDLAVRPLDAVAWMLHFPMVVEPRRGDAGPADERTERSIALLRAGQAAAALDALDAGPARPEDPASLVYRAGLLLQVGRLEQAEPMIAETLRRDPNSAEALALQAVIAVVRNDKERGLSLAERAVTLAPQSAAAWNALSYAQQAHHRLESALASVRHALDADPQNLVVWARRAELELSLGNVGTALQAAQRAVSQGPAVSKAHMVLGFIHLTRMDTGAAMVAFDTAARLDPTDPLPWLGRGLARIRQSDLAGGRADIELAVILDPRNSLLRSYLGKAYYEEGRGQLAAAEFALARVLDPNDPTPYLYDSIRKWTENRPVEALRDLEQSIARNDNRAVYRSRLLLDEDAQTRAASQAKIYADLGFEQLALVESVKSLQAAGANHSAHAFLADYYQALPRHEMARDSELLQAQLLQPLVSRPSQPRLSSYGLTFLDRSEFLRGGTNEYGALLSAQGLHASLAGAIGDRGTRSTSASLSGLGATSAFSIGHYALGTDGFRANNDQRLSVSHGFFQYSDSPASSLQLELKRVTKDLGDTAITFFDEDNSNPFVRNHFRADSLRAGWRRALTPSSVLLASYAYRDQTDDLVIPPIGYSSVQADRAHLLELRHIRQGTALSSTQGIGILSDSISSTDTIASDPSMTTRSRERHFNAYAYGYLRVGSTLDLTLGLSADDYSDEAISVRQLNPKVGLLWTSAAGTTVRVAAFRALKRKVVSGQTIEPTNIVGFPQFFSGISDLNGADTMTGGVAVAHRVSGDLALGVELTRRRVRLPAATVAAAEAVSIAETWAKAFAYWTPSKAVAVSLGVDREWLSAPATALTPILLTKSRTLSVPVEWRYFGPQGLLAALRVTHIRQSGDFFKFASGSFEPGRGRGELVDMSLGYRLPDRRGQLAIEVRNLFDDRFALQEINPQNSLLARRRTALVKVQIEY